MFSYLPKRSYKNELLKLPNINKLFGNYIQYYSKIVYNYSLPSVDDIFEHFSPDS